MTDSSHADRRPLLLILGFAMAKLAIHLPVLTRYGVHRDELYFIACGERFALGYADHAPIVPWLARLGVELSGGSWVSLRVLALLAGVGTLVVTGRLARALGGGPFAQALAMLAVLLAPVFLRTANQFSIPSFEPLVWTSASLVLVGLLRGGSPRRWLLFGAVTGLGLMVKPTMLLYGAAVVVGLALTPQRRHFRSPWLWAGGAVAAACFAPNLVWQAQNDWATFAFAANLNAEVMSRISRPAFLLGQVLYLGPATAPVWIAGVVWLLGRRPGASGGDVRALGWAWVVVIGALLVLRSKVYYSAPLYPTLFAAGGAAWAIWTERPSVRRWVRPLVFAVVLAGGAALAPLSLPVLPIERVDAFADRVTFGLAGDAHELTGDLHDMYGWEAQARAVYAVALGLPEADRGRLGLLAGNYGQAGALEYYAPPGADFPVVSPHLSYHLWAGEAADRDVFLAIGLPEEGLRAVFSEVTRVGTAAGSPHAVPWERDLPILLAREPRRPLVEAWADVPMEL